MWDEEHLEITMRRLRLVLGRCDVCNATLPRLSTLNNNTTDWQRCKYTGWRFYLGRALAPMEQHSLLVAWWPHINCLHRGQAMKTCSWHRQHFAGSVPESVVSGSPFSLGLTQHLSSCFSQRNAEHSSQAVDADASHLVQVSMVASCASSSLRHAEIIEILSTVKVYNNVMRGRAPWNQSAPPAISLRSTESSWSSQAIVISFCHTKHEEKV